MWIGTDQDSVVYDMDRRQVIGQLTNAGPIMLYGDPPRLLCCQRATIMAPNGLKKRLLEFITKLFRGRIKVPSSMPGLTYWILDLGHNTATRLGDIPGNPFTFYPSPDLHYGFTSRMGQTSITEVYLLELQHPSIQKLDVSGWPYDWWGNNQILLQTTNRDFVLYDVRKRTMAPLIGFGKLAAFLQETGIPVPLQVGAFAIWNGRENNFYLTDPQKKWLAEESFLIKVQRPDGKLKLISPRFKFEWSDHLDPSGRYYSFSGREAGDGSDAVFLRDLDSGTNRVLVPPTTNAYFSIPRFYRDSVFYVRSNALWLIGLDGSTNQTLFPPPMTQETTH
jgi:hypothetical protein